MERLKDPEMCIGYPERLWCHPDQCKAIDNNTGCGGGDRTNKTDSQKYALCRGWRVKNCGNHPKKNTNDRRGVRIFYSFFFSNFSTHVWYNNAIKYLYTIYCIYSCPTHK